MAHGRARRLALGLATAAAVLGGTELLLRATTDERDLLFAWEHPEGMIALLGDQVYVREAVSHSMQDGPYTWEVRTNSLGLREDMDSPAANPTGTTRWLALGDSWVFGTSVTQGMTIPDQVGTLLTTATGAQVDVLNGGIPGGSAFEMLARWSELSASLELDGLILGLPHNQHRQAELHEQRSTLFSRTGGAPYINSRIYLLARRAIAPYTRPRYADADVDTDAMDRTTVRDLKTIVGQARAMGLPVIVIEWPNDMRLAIRSVNPPATRWRAKLQPMGARFAGHALSERTCWGFEDHGHPSESGARAISEVIAAVITDGKEHESLQTLPSCGTGPEVGPGKAGWPIE
jgi:lysophospholipase L1-like esterase